MSDKKFIVTKNRGAVKKLIAAGIEPWCTDNDGNWYYANSVEVLSHLDEDDKHQLMYTDTLFG